MARVYTLGPDGKAQSHLYAATICVPKKRLYPAVKQIRKVPLGSLRVAGGRWAVDIHVWRRQKGSSGKLSVFASPTAFSLCCTFR